ncbi:MAG TPA: response regulator transcription factor [Candidatus Acidoferrum sp.]|nr:response regulator transcription factor [Candidatus Acidoferrum sp.]
MGAVAKNLVPQLVPLAAGQSSRHFTADSATPLRTIGMMDVQRLSQYVPVIVLVPAAAADGKLQGVTPRKISPVETAGAALLLQFLENAVSQPRSKAPADSLTFGEVTLNFSSMEATRKGRPVALTSLEFKTLKYMSENSRRVISRDELLNKVWGYENYPCTRTVDNLVLRLRQKLEREPSRPAHFHTVHGVGYKFLP